MCKILIDLFDSNSGKNLKKNFLLIYISLISLVANTAISQSFWTQTNGPFGSGVKGMVSTDTGNVFLSSRFFYRLNNNRDSVINITPGPINGQVGLTTKGVNGDVFVSVNNWIYRSNNHGDSWTPWVRTDSGGLYYDVNSVIFNTQGDIFAGCLPGLFRSTDNGQSWLLVGFTLSNIKCIAINKKGYIFVGVGEAYRSYPGVYRSTDNGNTWEVGFLYGGIDGSDVLSIAIDTTENIYVGTGTSVLRSTDDGVHWTASDLGIGPNSFPYVDVLAIKQNGHIFAGTLSGIFRSTDSGVNWTHHNTGLIDIKVRSLAIDTYGNIFAGTDNALFRSDNNGESWTEITKGMPYRVITALTTTANGNILVNADNDFFRSSDKGKNWNHNRMDYEGARVLSFDVNQKGNIFAGTIARGMWRSTDNGDSWKEIHGGPTVSALTIGSNGTLFAGTYYGVSRSTDEGDHWTHLQNSTSPLNLTVYALAVNRYGNIFAGTSEYYGIFRSTDDGEHWNGLKYLILPTAITSLVINSSNIIFAGTDINGGGAFSSTDNGDTWSGITAGQSDQTIHTLAINQKGYIFAGTDSVVLRSTNNGKQWTKLSFKYPVVNVRMLSIDSSGYVWAGTDEGLFRSITPTTDSKEGFQSSPKQFALYQNYPNPFNPVTMISYQLPVTNHVSLKVYDVIGREVATLVQEKLQAGEYSIMFDGSNFSSGTYFMRLQSGDDVVIKKLMLLK
jgi:photosystem II stability/assembly factor-like uncharacterized protein